MKIFNIKIIITIILTFTFLFTLSVLNNKSYALTLATPEIISFEASSSEQNALKIAMKSNNTGTNYSYEVFNTTNKKINNLAGSATSFTLQNLNPNTLYSVMIRICSNSKYSCSNWSNIKTATTTIQNNNNSNNNNNNNNNSNPSPTVITTNMIAYTFSDVNQSATITATSSTGEKVSFSSSNPGVATVDQNGLVKSIKPGSAVIAASANGSTESIQITVVSIGQQTENGMEKQDQAVKHKVVSRYQQQV